MTRTLRLAVAATLALPAAAAAQAQWLPATQGSSWEVEYVHPHAPVQRDGSRVFGIESPWVQGAFFLGREWRLGTGARVRAELPIAVLLGRSNGCLDADCTAFHHGAAIGNPYLGIELPLAGPRVRLHAGLRPPLQQIGAYDNTTDHFYGRYAAEAGQLAARNDRIEAFTKGTSSGLAQLELRPRLDAHTELRAQAGALLAYDRGAWQPVMDRRSVQWRAGVHLWHSHGAVQLGVGGSLVNRPFIYSRRTTEYEWGGSAGVRIGSWLPLVQVRVPGNKVYDERLKWWTLGLALQHAAR